MKVKKKREARSEFICVASKQTKRKLETGDLFCRHSFSDLSLSLSLEFWLLVSKVIEVPPTWRDHFFLDKYHSSTSSSFESSFTFFCI